VSTFGNNQKSSIPIEYIIFLLQAVFTSLRIKEQLWSTRPTIEREARQGRRIDDTQRAPAADVREAQLPGDMLRRREWPLGVRAVAPFSTIPDTWPPVVNVEPPLSPGKWT
jgi:hypothetical protein